MIATNACIPEGETQLPVLDLESIKSINKAAPPEPVNESTLNPQITPEIREIAQLNVDGFQKFQAGNFDEAIAIYDKAIEKNPTFALTYGNRGNARMAKGQVDLAIADYTKGIEVNPVFAEAYLDRGMAYLATEKYEPGISDLEKGLSIKPQFPSHHGNLAWAYIIVKKFDKAIESAQRGLDLDPKAVWIKANKAHGLLFSNQFEKALATYKEGFGTVLHNNKKFEEGVLEDFKFFKTKGLEHQDIPKIEAEIAKLND